MASDLSLVDAGEVIAVCQTDLALGLTAAEAARRLERDGANEICTVAKAPPGIARLPGCAIRWPACWWLLPPWR